jgi:myosin heavy chain 9/10/11/14
MLTVIQLERNLEAAESSRASEARRSRTEDRTIRDLQGQIERREKLAATLEEDLTRQRDKNATLLQTISDLQTSDTENQLAARRAEREFREEHEKVLRLERELEGWKGLRFEKGSARAPGSLRVPSGSVIGSVRGRRDGSVAPDGGNGIVRETSPVPGANPPVVIPPRVSRRVSNTKGFL